MRLSVKLVLSFFRWWRLTSLIDWSIYISPIILSAFSALILYSYRGQSPSLVVNQLIYTTVGVSLMLGVTFFNYRNFRVLSWYLYGLMIVALGLVLVWGDQVYGAKRWLDFSIFQFQPSEVTKLAAILVISSSWSIFVKHPLRIVALVVGIFSLPMILVVIEPDIGTASVFGVLLISYLVQAKLSNRYLTGLLIILMLIAPIVYQNLRPYQKARLVTFIDPGRDPQGSGYNATQSIIAVGSGGIWGRGLGQGTQSQLQFLPVAHTDFIFAGIAEAFGFIGASILLTIMVVLIWRSINVMSISQDTFGRMIAYGVAIVWFYQGATNVAMNLAILPVTGIPLPFVSYGGTATLVNYLSAGLLQSIYLRHKKIRFG